MLISFNEFYNRLRNDNDLNNFYRFTDKITCQGLINQGYSFYIYNEKSIKYIGFDKRNWLQKIFNKNIHIIEVIDYDKL